MAGEPKAVVEIGLAEIYNTLIEVKGSVGTLVEQQGATSKRGDDQESRLRDLERRVWAIPSFAVLVSLVSLAVAVWSKFPR